jgi:predicted transcriptional regulator
MPRLTSLELPDLVFKRIEALASAKKTSPSKLAAQVIASFASSAEARRAIRKHRKGKTLADLGWMDDYEGHSIDDILSYSESENAYQLLCVLEESIERHWKKRPGMRTGVENIVVAVMALMREVGNGGFDQFYRNSSKRFAFFVQSALLHVGRKDAAKIALRAERALGKFEGWAKGPGIGEAFKELDEKMSRPSARRDHVLEDCDIAFDALTGLPESLLAYAREHTDGILRQS